MIRFETSEDKSWKGKNRLVIHSTHMSYRGVLANMFGNPGSPMLDVDDAIELRNILESFIKKELSK